MNTQFICHRVNTIVELAKIDPRWGVEIDLRSNIAPAGSLHLSHDPWAEGESFEEWLAAFKAHKIQGPIILNTKEDGLETRTVELLQKFGIHRFFFLDTTIPTLVKCAIRNRQTHFAARISSVEPIESLRAFRQKIEWVWVDCFEGMPLKASLLELLKSDFKLCLVSPELQGRPLETSVSEFLEIAHMVDAICTKDPNLWIKSLG